MGSNSTTSNEPLAIRYFDAWMVHSALESEVEEALITSVGGSGDNPNSYPFTYSTFDWYDGSFEFKKTTEDWEPTPEMIQVWKDLGFSRCWICYGVDKAEPGYHEKYIDLTK